MNIPPHYVDNKRKEIVFLIPSGYPMTLGIPTWVKALSLPSDYKGVVIRCSETFYIQRARVND
jgi:hypothetical protein